MGKWCRHSKSWKIDCLVHFCIYSFSHFIAQGYASYRDCEVRTKNKIQMTFNSWTRYFQIYNFSLHHSEWMKKMLIYAIPSIDSETLCICLHVFRPVIEREAARGKSKISQGKSSFTPILLLTNRFLAFYYHCRAIFVLFSVRCNTIFLSFLFTSIQRRRRQTLVHFECFFSTLAILAAAAIRQIFSTGRSLQSILGQ